MTEDTLNDESEAVATIAGRRIDMIDVMAALESPDPETQFYDDWELTEAQVQAAREYIHDHRDELEERIQE